MREEERARGSFPELRAKSQYWHAGLSWGIVHGMDAVTLLAIVQDVRRALMGASVQTVRPAGRYGLWIGFVTPSGGESLLLAADEPFPRLARGADRPAGPGQLSPLAGVARRLLPGTRLQAVTHHGLDRVVSLELAHPSPAGEADWVLIAEMFGRQPNLILVDNLTGKILEATRHIEAANGRAIGPERPYVPPPAPVRSDPRLLGDVEAISALLAPHLAAGLGPPVALRQSFTGLTVLWEQEVAARTGNGTATQLAKTLLNLIHEVEAGPWEPRLVLNEARQPVAASPVRLCHVPEARQQACASLGEMVERLASHLGHQHAVTTRRTTLRQVLRRLEVRLRSRRAKLAAESLEFGRADLSRWMGEILVAHQDDVRRGAAEVTLLDHTSGEAVPVTIPLDPTLSPSENAERLFKLARRGRRGAIRVVARLAETEGELGRVHAWIQRVAEATSLESLERIRKEMDATPRLLAPQDRARLGGSLATTLGEPKRRPAGQAPLRPGGGGAGRNRGASLDPRRFVSSDGFPILVGRDTRGNDYLTLHLAKSQDLWLHVQGYAGSHVIIRLPNRSNPVPRRTLIQAAQLAAYYSQARDHGKVAVDYTLRKYVHKPKKAKPGLVSISQEKTIIVSPDKSLVQKLAAPADR